VTGVTAARRWRPSFDATMIRQLVANNAVLALQYAVSALLPLILVPHIVRSIGVSSYGRIAVAASWAALAVTVVQYAFQFTGLRRVAQTPAGESSGGVFADVIVAKLVLLACIAPILTVIALRTLTSGWSHVQLVVLVGLPIAATLNSAWYLQARGRFFSICVISIAATVAALWIGFFRVSGGDTASVWGAAAATVIGPLVAGAATLLAAWKMAGVGRAVWLTARPIDALRDGWPLFLSQSIAALYGACGPIAISWLRGAAEVGTYSVVERFINALVGACLLTHTAAYPRLAALYAQDSAAYRRLLKLVTALYVGLATSIAGAAWLCRDALISFLFGRTPALVEPLIAAGLVWLLLSFFGTAVTGYLTVSGRSREVTRITLQALCLTLAFGVPGVVIFGGWAWMASLVVGQIPVLMAARRSWREESALER
jgi:PST family polysaccharide transporter